MSVKKSKPYEIGGSKYSFNFVDGKLVGIQKANSEGNFDGNYLNPNTSEFSEIVTDPTTGKSTTEALDAYNTAKHGPNKNAYLDPDKGEKVVQATSSELNKFYNDFKKKSDNQQSISPPLPKNPVYADSGLRYEGGSNYKRKNTTGKPLYAYPFDIDPFQDHLKIQQWQYVRRNVNASGASTGPSQTTNIAGESVKGSELQGSILLPMPKVVDVNGADWGENKLTAFGIGILGATSGLARAVGLTPGETLDDKERKRLLEEELEAADIKVDNVDKLLSGLSQATQASQSALLTGATGFAGNALGVSISPDTILARTSGVVLNPNAEMLFQGPVIRDFNFSFNMIARSQKEGAEIRRIIKFLKKGMAPQFRNAVFIKSPNIFTLEYRNAGGVLDTVNKFNPGGLALTTINVDYAPSGYWSAYRDSQPVAVKMDLNFSELRPIYQADQENDEVFSGFDSVGY